MPAIAIRTDFQQAQRVLADVSHRAANPGPAMALMPGIIRHGLGSLEEQIRSRTRITVTGARHPWPPAVYERGAMPAFAKASEDIMWRAALGTGPGAITQAGARFATIAVDDNVVRLLASQLEHANRIVARTSYFGFVTGDFGAREAPARTVADKPALVRQVPFRRGPRRGPRVRRQRPPNWTRFNATKAQWWRLGLTFGYWAREGEIRGGIAVPPKGIGFSRPMIERLQESLVEFILGPEFRAQGRRFEAAA